MSAVLSEHQHELCELDGSNGFLFGTRETGYLTTTRPQVVASDGRTGDVDRPQEDSRAFGRDYRGAKSYAFEVNVLTDVIYGPRHRTNLDYVGMLDAVWNDEKWRDHPSSFAMLRSCEGGLTSRCYGRPRQFAEVAGKLTEQGSTPTTFVFDLIDDRWYDDIPKSVDLSMLPASEGGLVAPIVAPITTTRPEEDSGVMVVGGTRPTWPVVEFTGPITDPAVIIGGLRIGFNMVLGNGVKVTFDPRPWVRSATRGSGASVRGKVDYRTPKMRDCRVRPGVYNLVFKGKDLSGNATCRVTWRDARSRP